MKKLVLIAFCSALCLTACNNEGGSNATSSDKAATQQTNPKEEKVIKQIESVATEVDKGAQKLQEQSKKVESAVDDLLKDFD
jgi:TolA-binding protein